MYTNRETAPKGFLNFYRFVTLPISILVLILDIFQTNTIVESGVDGFVRIAVLYDVLMIILAVICIYGLGKWAYYSYISVLLFQWSAVGLNILLLLFFGIEDVTSAGTYIGQVIGSLIWAIVITIYFVHRRPLFDKKYEQSSQISERDSIESVKKMNVGNEEKSEKTVSTSSFQYELFCNQCGSPLICGAKFCSKCGAEVMTLYDTNVKENAYKIESENVVVERIDKIDNDEIVATVHENSEIEEKELMDISGLTKSENDVAKLNTVESSEVFITEEKRIEYLKEYAELKEKGIISQDEFDEKKKEIFSRKTINI